MSYLSWFIPLCIIISVIFAIAILILTIATLIFRAAVRKKYDRGRLSG